MHKNVFIKLKYQVETLHVHCLFLTFKPAVPNLESQKHELPNIKLFHILKI